MCKLNVCQLAQLKQLRLVMGESLSAVARVPG